LNTQHESEWSAWIMRVQQL